MTLAALESAAALVGQVMPPTPQYCWPLLSARCGCAVWVKHENHTPVGAFKVRGGLVYMDHLRQAEPGVAGVICATRGNHGQSVAFAARRYGLTSAVVVPHGNSVEKNAAMRALGAELVEHGRDFQDAYDHARQLSAQRKVHLVPSFHPWLVAGVATYSLEFLSRTPDLDSVYVPVGQGSGICGMIAARDALRRRTHIVGVVSERLPAYALSVQRGQPVETPPADTIADGVACRVPDPDALKLILKGVERVVAVSEAAIRAAMRYYFTDTHNVAEGAGAAPLAALLAERDRMAGKNVGLVLSGGNVDRDVFAGVLAED
ncbi:MAG TPA: threonine dehydratase [Gemmatimonadales bacterium]|nr:threonine dehydratase [Gemmatimonadales bacterium]